VIWYDILRGQTCFHRQLDENDRFRAWFWPLIGRAGLALRFELS